MARQFFGGLGLTMKERKIYVNTTKAALITAMVAGLALSVAGATDRAPDSENSECK
jgi:hypothetical protein